MRLFTVEKIINPSTGELLYPKGTLLTEVVLQHCQSIGIGQFIRTLTVLDTSTSDNYWAEYISSY